MLHDSIRAAHEELPAEHGEENQVADETQVSRRLLRAVETYKAACIAAGEEPTVEDSWLVLLSALRLEDDK